MRIGIDLRITHFAKTGFYRYGQGVLTSLRRFPPEGDRFVLLQHPEDHSFAPLPPNVERVPLSAPLFSADEEHELRREIGALHLDAIHFPFSLLPGRVAERVILTIHDLTCEKFPELIEDRYLATYRHTLRCADAADRIVAISQEVAADLVTAGIDADKIRACHPLTPFESPAPEPDEPVDKDLVEEVTGSEYILSVGSLEPRKNHLATLAALAELRRHHAAPVRLVLVGSHGWLMGPFLDALDNHPFARDILCVPDANDATVRHLLRHCTLFLNLSRYEGFGLPVLEALAEGACVLSTPTPSLTESSFPTDLTLETAEPQIVAKRAAELLADAASRRDLAALARSVVGAFYRASDPARLSKIYAP